ncbi:MAG: 50S ribosomal protein L6 [Patescibacteria group bacterium]
MSRIGKKPIVIPSGVTVAVADGVVRVTGPKGTLEERLHPHVTVQIADNTITVSVSDAEEKGDRSLWGLFGSLIRNMITGVTQGYEKKLEMQGVGYKMALQGQNLRLDVGFSHPVFFAIPAGVAVSVDKNIITVQGASKQQVGETAAQIRHIKKPEPYKGKGIRYVNEVVRRKAGKSATKAAA